MKEKSATTATSSPKTEAPLACPAPSTCSTRLRRWRMATADNTFPLSRLALSLPLLRLFSSSPSSSPPVTPPNSVPDISALQPTLPSMDDRMSTFVVGSNYQVLDVIGEGAYGIVWQVSSPSPSLSLTRSSPPSLHQLSPPHPLPAQGRHQTHHPLRPLHVLSPHPPRNQTSSPLPSRKHHLNTRHPQAPQP